MMYVMIFLFAFGFWKGINNQALAVAVIARRKRVESKEHRKINDKAKAAVTAGYLYYHASAKRPTLGRAAIGAAHGVHALASDNGCVDCRAWRRWGETERGRTVVRCFREAEGREASRIAAGMMLTLSALRLKRVGAQLYEGEKAILRLSDPLWRRFCLFLRKRRRTGRSSSSTVVVGICEHACGVTGPDLALLFLELSDFGRGGR